MKILHIADYYGTVPGTFVASLSSLMDRGIEEAFIFPVARPWQDDLRRKGAQVFVFKLRSLFDLPSYLKILGIIRRERIDIVHTHYSRTANIFAAKAKIFFPRLKVVWHWRMPMGVEATLLEKDIRGPLLRFYHFKRRVGNIFYRVIDSLFVDFHVAVSECVGKNVLLRNITNRRKLAVVLNGLDTSIFDPEKATLIRQALGLKDEDLVLVCAAHMRRQKDHRTLLKAFSIVEKKYPSAKLILAGEGALEGEARGYAAQLGLGRSVLFLGPRKDVRDILAISDIGVLASLYEGFCFFAIESLVMGKPIVATDVCGLSEAVAAGRDGFLVPPKDPAALAEKISFLIDHPEIRRKMGQSGRRKVLDHFTLERWSRDMEGIYAALLREKPRISPLMFSRRFVYKALECFYFSAGVRVIWAGCLRAFFWKEYRSLKGYVVSRNAGGLKKAIVAINCRSAIFEHVKEIYFRLENHPKLLPLAITTAKFFRLQAKQRFFSRLETKYGLVYGKNYFSYAWLPKIRPRIYLEPQPTPYGDLCRGAIKVMYVHGLANLGFSKDFKHIRCAGKYDYLLLTGPLQKRAILQAQKMYGGRLPQLVEVGFLRGDRLLAQKRSFDKGAALAEMGLEEMFTILFAPTWGDFSATREWIDKMVEASRMLDANILIRLHPILTSGKTGWETGGVDWDLKLKELAQKYKRVHIASDDDIDAYLLSADVCVTDASSVGMEFMILEKPAIFLPVPHFFKMYGKDRPIAWVREGLEVDDKEQLMDQLKVCMSDRHCLKSYPLKDMIYNPGKALEAIVSFLEGIAG